MVWENIARTGEVPEAAPALAAQGPMERLAELRESFGEADWLVNLTKEEMRDEQVWVGGTAYSPHGALFVPPVPERVAACLEDLVSFVGRDDVGPIAKAAIAHAQLETIHPFIDGNGRTGRALLHRILRREGVLSHATLPISAGLLHDVDGYMSAIRSYQEGELLPIIESVTGALELSLVVGRRVAERIDDVMNGWRSSISERAGSAIWRLPVLLAEQPVVTVAYVAENLGITPRAASTLVQRACGYGMLRPLGSRRRGDYYQSDELIAVLEDISSSEGIRRVLAGQVFQQWPRVYPRARARPIAAPETAMATAKSSTSPHDPATSATSAPLTAGAV